MRRREFIGLVGGAATWPFSVSGQQTDRVRRIGAILALAAGDPQQQRNVAAFTQMLRELGWVVGRNIQIEYRSAAADSDNMQALAKELVGLQPDVIMAVTTRVAAALQRETQTIPIVFLAISDPIGSGFVASLSRPDGNMTGFIDLEGTLGGKWIELLKECVPSVSRIGLMFNPDTAPYMDYYMPTAREAARSLAIELITAPVRGASEIQEVIDGLRDNPGSALAIMPDPFLPRHRDLIISLANRHHVPTIYPFQYMAAAGGLMSYGIDTVDSFRKAPAYIDRILKGDKPADLPVQAPTRFVLVINLKTAKALGLTVPLSLLARADEVIE